MTTLKRANKGRVATHFNVGDFVLIHKSRWPNKRIPKLESPWLGPFRVHEVHHSSLLVMASPTLGGLIKVSISMIKKWSEVHDVHEILDDDQAPPEEDDQGNGGEPIEMTKDEMELDVFFNVEDILKHKFSQGWRFLTHWEGFPISDATWEPIKSFIQPGGVVNSKFKEYCDKAGIQDILLKALRHH